METLRVNTWNELQDALFGESWNPHLGRFRSREAYRGLSDATYPLETTLIRLRGEYPVLERHLLRNFRKYAHRRLVEQDSLWHWLSLAQHHGLPTRLLDWTYSPYAALHFVTANLEKFDIDGVIWAANYVNTHKRLPNAFSIQLEKEGANIFTTEILGRVVRELSDFQNLLENDYALFFEPPSIDDRIVNQHAFFSVMPQSSGRIDQFLEKHENLGRRILIPAELKWEIRDKLDQANISERVLFPGLDGLSSWLKRQYSIKNIGGL